MDDTPIASVPAPVLNELIVNVERRNVKQLCPSCNTTFETPYPDHIYCTDTCQRREKHRRRKERRLAGRAHSIATIRDDSVALTLPSPSDRELTEYCLAVAEGKYTKEILIIGFLPANFIQPPSVDIVKQPEEANQPDKWVMRKHIPSILDELYGKV
jgi:hypothetical protein